MEDGYYDHAPSGIVEQPGGYQAYGYGVCQEHSQAEQHTLHGERSVEAYAHFRHEEGGQVHERPHGGNDQAGEYGSMAALQYGECEAYLTALFPQVDDQGKKKRAKQVRYEEAAYVGDKHTYRLETLHDSNA